MKEIDIYVLGSYNGNTDSGTWTYYMYFKGAIKKAQGKLAINAGSAQKLMLVALIEAVSTINEPCFINIKSKTGLGFANPNKSVNKWLIDRFTERIVQGCHKYVVDDRADFRIIKQWEDAYGKR